MRTSRFIILITGIILLLLTGCQNQNPRIIKKDIIISCKQPGSECTRIGKISAPTDKPSSRTWTTNCSRCKNGHRLLKDKAITRGANYVWLRPSNKTNQIIGIAYWCPGNC